MNKIQPQEEDKRQFRNIIDQKLSKSGEKERLKEFLRLKLSECGWREEIKHYCKEYISSKGLETVSLEKLIEEITPHARGKHSENLQRPRPALVYSTHKIAKVPESIKSELFALVRDFLNQNP